MVSPTFQENHSNEKTGEKKEELAHKGFPGKCFKYKMNIYEYRFLT